MTSYVEAIEAAVRRSERTVVALSHRIHAHPELGWQEVSAAAWIAEVLHAAEFSVVAAPGGLATALVASSGTGPLHVGLCAEYDALPGMGHACGHNMIAAMAVGAALGLAAVADDLGLRVTVLGTPAEEGGGGKIELLDRGVFDDLHVALMAHPGPGDAMQARPLAVSHSRVRFCGHTAHAAAYPHLGVNAADAFTVAEVAIALLRQQLPVTTRVHGIRTWSGDAPNAIPDRTEGRWYVRAERLADLAELEERVHACFRAGAIATGCDLHIEPESKPYSEFVNDSDLLTFFTRHWQRLRGAQERARGDQSKLDLGDQDLGTAMARASTDMGNVSLRLSAIHPYLGVNSGSAVNHQPAFAAHCVTSFADQVLIDGAVALALTAADAAVDPAVRTRLLVNSLADKTT